MIGAIDLQSKLSTNSNSAGYLPKKLGDARVLTSIVHPGIMNGCDLYIFKLEQVISNKIKEIGITYIEGDTKPRAGSLFNNSNSYYKWQYTPVAKDSDSRDALRCGETDRELIERIRGGMNSAGGYYIMSEDKEGAIVVLPNENLAAFLHYW